MIKLYIIVLCILIIAIIANVVAAKFNIETWHEFGPVLFSKGISTIKEIGFFNALWLFVIYPIVLSCGYIIGERIYNIF